ncbi:MAG TPA: (5-formylfuran-3-yl)methyl phosphate synthase [Halobacteria archaeon]|nr:(5-formylfuran-3-yl)methyl phosphate synthase [Halobacteria archaeon]
MRLLVSPRDVEEAKSAVEGGADIIDVKNPKEGSLGANFPWIIREIRRVVPKDIPLSATIGDFCFKPGTASLAALGAVTSGADYIKIGLYGITTKDEAIDMVYSVSRSIKEYDHDKKVVIAAYSDFERIGSISPLLLPEICTGYDVDVVMVDTGIKDGRSTLEFMPIDTIKTFINKSHSNGFEVAIAGSLSADDIERLTSLDPDIIGVRGIVCGGDRNADIDKNLVKALKECVS